MESKVGIKFFLRGEEKPFKMASELLSATLYDVRAKNKDKILENYKFLFNDDEVEDSDEKNLNLESIALQ